jgi:gliding motility-associated lipoprotein GldD
MLRKIAPCLLLFAFMACRPDVFPPKPPGYFRIDTPATHTYQLFDKPEYPYTFEYPANSTIAKDTVFDHGKVSNQYWVNIYIPGLGGIINITYKPITREQTLVKLVDEAWDYSFFHHEKAEGYESQGFMNQNGVSGVLYTVSGNSASRYQFTATDSVHHFIRGALYFDVTPNADSLKPATDFIVQDIQHLLLTRKWKEPK